MLARKICGVNAQNIHMKKGLTIIIVIICALLAASGCVKFISDTGGYYIPSDIAEFTSVTCQTGENEVKVHKKDGYYVVLTKGETYILTQGFGAIFDGGDMRELDEEQSKAALYSLMSETGLIYTAMDKKGYIMTDTSGKYRADAEKFFYKSEYMRRRLNGESTENFSSYFESAAPQKFGDFEDYKITLDCSKQNEMTLKIENIRYALASEYLFKDINDTHIPLTAQMLAYLDAHALSA